MLGYTPRVNGNSPGRPIASGAGTSASVYSGWIGSPDSVVNEVGRSGVAAYRSAHASSAVLSSVAISRF